MCNQLTVCVQCSVCSESMYREVYPVKICIKPKAEEFAYRHNHSKYCQGINIEVHSIQKGTCASCVYGYEAD